MADTPLTMESLQETIKNLVEDEKTWVLDKLLLSIMDKYETVEELDEDIKAIDEEFEDGEVDDELEYDDENDDDN
ncbi:hypothetical protein N9852_00410 [Alphaproteobacteria bacterium]|jgi:hypothetical protein|nr:hypothetical protein [Alphaproteobacteria bacterium]|tara:strand:+ start:1292 stop:1516 length:225 start_codon:yes stop_codon:yes gene_type:complete